MSFGTASTFGMEHSQETDGLKQLFDNQFAEISETLDLAQSIEFSWCSCCGDSCCDAAE